MWCSRKLPRISPTAESCLNWPRVSICGPSCRWFAKLWQMLAELFTRLTLWPSLRARSRRSLAGWHQLRQSVGICAGQTADRGESPGRPHPRRAAGGAPEGKPRAAVSRCWRWWSRAATHIFIWRSKGNRRWSYLEHRPHPRRCRRRGFRQSRQAPGSGISRWSR